MLWFNNLSLYLALSEYTNSGLWNGGIKCVVNGSMRRLWA